MAGKISTGARREVVSAVTERYRLANRGVPNSYARSRMLLTDFACQ